MKKLKIILSINRIDINDIVLKYKCLLNIPNNFYM